MVRTYSECEQCVDAIVQRIGNRLVVGTPLGLGKANLLLNAIYQRALVDRDIELTIFTALTLEVPASNSELERRFLEPLLHRWFDGYPELDYAVARGQGTLPSNVTVHEFFFSPGKFLNNVQAQQNYISSNYTHVARDMLSRGVNVVMQMVSPGVGINHDRLSLSCNPDVTLELIPKMRQSGRDVIVVGETNEALPFMYGDADVSKDFFDVLFIPPQKSYPLFGPPKDAVNHTDYLIGLHASALVRDDGTLQVGIGSLGDAVSYCLGLRQDNNATYKKLLDQVSSSQSRDVQERLGERGVFKAGLYGATEMFVDGFLYLFDKQVLCRRVYDDIAIQSLLNENKISSTVTSETLDQLEQFGAFSYPLKRTDIQYLQAAGVLSTSLSTDANSVTKGSHRLPLDADREPMRTFLIEHGLGERLANPSVMHGGFYLGNQSFYQRLRDLNDDQRSLLKMTGVDRINQLYRGEDLDRLQRHRARFINSCLMVTLNGTVVSDALENTKVLSGVGGQYNFVAMAHALDGARSIIKLRSTYHSSSGLRSNIVLSYGHATIPRHLRDIVVTEYGCADLRGSSESECAKALINIADSRFQEELLLDAKAAGKVESEYKIPAEYTSNTPDRYASIMQQASESNLFPLFPISADLTDNEIAVGAALKELKRISASRLQMIKHVAKSVFRSSSDHLEKLACLDLHEPKTLRERVLQKIVASLF